MFERFTEKGRRAIFFARYEASRYGSPYMETEHLLLGILREDKALTRRCLRAPGTGEMIRRQIDAHTTIREPVPTSVDLPLSNEFKRILAYAAEEAERLAHNQIGTEHLFLGLLREEKCFAAEILQEQGLQLSSVREEFARGVETPIVVSPAARSLLSIVAISSIPAGAEIEVDNAFLGHTPAEVPLAIGERMINITKEGYRPWRRILRVLAGAKQTVSAELEQLPE